MISGRNYGIGESTGRGVGINDSGVCMSTRGNAINLFLMDGAPPATGCIEIGRALHIKFRANNVGCNSVTN